MVEASRSFLVLGFESSEPSLSWILDGSQSNIRHRVTFNPYTMNQPRLLPPRLDELIPENHLVRVVNRASEQLDLAPLLARYKGGGTCSYHPQMML